MAKLFRVGTLLAMSIGVWPALARQAFAADDAKIASATEEKECDCADRGRGRYGCPLYPIAVYPSGTFYFAELFDPTCDVESRPTYVFGDYQWPWQICPDDCADLSREAAGGGDVRIAKEFEGMSAKVGFDYMHRHVDAATANELAGRRPEQTCFPGGPARACCRVDQRLNNLFLKVETDSAVHYAKVLQLEVNVEKASFRNDENRWRPTYVAFEVAGKPPSTSGYEVVDAFDVADVQPVANPYVKQARFRRGYGQLARVLILLSK